LLLISGAVLWALRSNHAHNPAPDELYSTDHHNVADGLTMLPQDYAGISRNVPRLGPPLPGDLGSPIVTAEGQSAPIGLDAEQQRANQETEAARVSKVLPRRLPPLHRSIIHLRKHPPTPLYLPTSPLRRMDRIASFSSSMHPSTGGLRRLTGSHVLHHPLSCRRGRSFLRH
jgi:hypothetical protein